MCPVAINGYARSGCSCVDGGVVAQPAQRERTSRYRRVIVSRSRKYDWAGPRVSRGLAPPVHRGVTRATCDDVPVALLRRPAHVIAAYIAQYHLSRPRRPQGLGDHRRTPCGYHGDIIAPSLIPIKPSVQRKHDKYDAGQLTRLYRAGELTTIRIPSEAEERVRDVVRCRETLQREVVKPRLYILKFLARRGYIYRAAATSIAPGCTGGRRTTRGCAS